MVDEFGKEFEKIAINGQVYNTRLKVDCFVFADADWSDTDFDDLIDDTIQAVAATSGYSYIVISECELGYWQPTAGKKKIGFYFKAELLKKENW